MKHVLLVISVLLLAFGIYTSVSGVLSNSFEILIDPFWLFYGVAFLFFGSFLFVEHIGGIKTKLQNSEANLTIERRNLAKLNGELVRYGTSLEHERSRLSARNREISKMADSVSMKNDKISKFDIDLTITKAKLAARDEEIKALKASVHSYKANFAKYNKKNYGTAFRITWTGGKSVWIVREVDKEGIGKNGFIFISPRGEKPFPVLIVNPRFVSGFKKEKASPEETKLLYDLEQENKK